MLKFVRCNPGASFANKCHNYFLNVQPNMTNIFFLMPYNQSCELNAGEMRSKILQGVTKDENTDYSLSKDW